MKIPFKKLSLVFIALMCGAFVFSAPSPPAPNPSLAPPPPGLPIDDGVYILAAVSVLLAFYKIPKIKKTSV